MHYDSIIRLRLYSYRYCFVLTGRQEYNFAMGYVLAFVYVENIISRPKALQRMSVEDYQEMREVST